MGLKQRGVTQTSARIPTGFLMVRHTTISCAASLSLNLFIHGRMLVKAMPRGCSTDQRSTSKVLSTHWCIVNRDCYFKCIRHTESLLGKGLRIRRQISHRERIFSISTSTLENLECEAVGERKKIFWHLMFGAVDFGLC